MIDNVLPLTLTDDQYERESCDVQKYYQWVESRQVWIHFGRLLPEIDSDSGDDDNRPGKV